MTGNNTGDGSGEAPDSSDQAKQDTDKETSDHNMHKEEDEVENHNGTSRGQEKEVHSTLVVEDKENPIPGNAEIDLSLVKPKYNVKAKSTMRPLLTEYGLPEEKRKTLIKEKEDSKVNKHQSKKGKTITSWAEDRAAEKERQKREQQMRMYESIHKLRDRYYHQYAQALQDKVEHQREEIKKKTEQLESRLIRQEHLEKEERHKVKKRLTRHEFTHDDTFLNRLPKSSYYKILSLLDKLKAEGQIRNQSDLDTFWNHIRRPEVYRQNFPASITGSTDASSAFSSNQKQIQLSTKDVNNSEPLEVLDHRPLTGITEQSSRPSTREASNSSPWAVTQLAQHKHRRPQKPKDPNSIAKDAAVALEKQFPPMVLPKLHCFNMELSEKPPDPDEVLQEMEGLKREQERRLYVRRLRKMYNLALSNTASAQRIMEQHNTDLDLAIEGPSIAELTSYYQHISDDEDTDNKKFNLALEGYEHSALEQPWMKYINTAKKIGTIEEVSEGMSTANPSQRSTAKNRKSRSAGHLDTKKNKRASSGKIIIEPPPPLTLDCINANQDKILEPKCKSTLWTNYAKAGKSVFAGQ